MSNVQEMRIIAVVASAAMWINGAAARGAQAPSPSEIRSMAVVPLRNGPNQVDLDGDGRMDLVFVAWRENFNAHGFRYVTFYRSTRDTPAWNLVPFFKQDERADFTSFQSYHGADCTLRDIRLLRPRAVSAAPTVAVVAERQFGESFDAQEVVTFTVYRAARNREEVPGSPAFSFRAAGTIVSKAAYCDVGEAFASELGIGRE
jgi:carbapenem resistance CarG-like protein